MEEGPVFDCSTVVIGDQVLVAVRGEVDAATADRFRTELVAADALGPRVTLDLAGVTFMDSTGVTALIRAFGSDLSERCVITAASIPVRRLFEVIGLTELISPDADQRPGE